MKELERIEEIGVLPVIAINDIEKAEPLAEALLEGGLPAAEITFRTDAAEESIRRVAKKYPDVLVGAGTVLSCEQVDRAVSAGAQFVVTPGFNPRVVDYCLKKNVLIAPGCSTPSDMEQAVERDITVVKFFPAEQAGGLEYIKAVSAPYSMLSFMPTGGINIKNLKKYLEFSKVIACGGSWMVKSKLIDGNRFDEIKKLCEEASSIVKKIRKGAEA